MTQLVAGMTWPQIQRAKREAVWDSWRLRAEAKADTGGTPPGWHTVALCTKSTIDFTDGRQEAAALALCEQCPARLECLTDAVIEERAVPRDLRHGVRGGLPARARRTKFERPRPACGTVAGYHAHQRHGETPDQPCKDAYSRSIDPAKRKINKDRYLARRKVA